MTSQKALSKIDLTYEIVYNSGFVLEQSPTALVKTVVEGPTRTTHMLRVGVAEYGAAQFYQLDEASKIIWDLIDGKRAVGDILREAKGSRKVAKEDDVYGTLLFFAESGALKAKQDPVPWKRVRVASSFMTQVVLIKDSTKVLGYVHRAIRPALRSGSLWASMAIALAGAVIYAPRFNSIFSDARNFQVLGSSVVGYLFYNFVILAPVIVIHELAHGIALLHYSGRSGEIGTGWFYFGPTFYVDVTGYWVLPRRQRLVIMWAGNLTTILIGSLLVLSQLAFQLPLPVEKTLDIAAFWCFYSTLWNLAPPFETDGYYILTDLLKIPNLRSEGFGYLKSLIIRAFGRHNPEPEGVTGRKKATLLGYAIFSIIALGYIGFQSFRFALYMGTDASAWGGRILGQGTSFSPVSLVVALTSMGYFTLTMSGYSVLIANQIKKSRVRGLKFEAVHDRDLAVFFYLPQQVFLETARRFSTKVTKLARDLTPDVSLGRKGHLLYAKMGIGSSNLPISQIKLHLRQIEGRFYRAYQEFLDDNFRGFVTLPARATGGGREITSLLRDMAGKTPLGERGEVKQALKESLRRQEMSLRHLLGSTFAAAWTIETPPAQQYDLLQSLLPRVLIEDLIFTNLAGEAEEFKKRTIYGLDTIAELATSASDLRDRALAHPEKFEIVSFFEPVRGRITFLGRTEKIEESLKELGVLFIIQVWSGFVDSLLADANLNLYTIAQSLPAIPDDLSGLLDGELSSLSQYITALDPLENEMQNSIATLLKASQSSLRQLRELKTLFEPKGEQRLGEFDSILSLNVENIKSIPVRLKDTSSMSRTGFEWLRVLRGLIDSEQEKREAARLIRKKVLARRYLIVAVPSLILGAAGLLQPTYSIRLGLFAGILLLQATYARRFYMFHRSAHAFPRYSSTLFAQILPPIYAVAQAINVLLIGMNVLDLEPILEASNKASGKIGGV